MARSARRFAAISTSVIVAAVLLVGAPGPTRATASVLWVAQSGTAVVPGTSCTNPGYVGTTDVAIQAAINNASSDAVIHICKGTYSIGATLDLGSTPLTLVGERASTTILDGGSTLNRDGSWASGGVQILKTTANLTVQTLTFRRGHYATDTPSGAGAIDAYGTSAVLTVTSCSFLNNSTVNRGGAIRARNLTVTNSTFTRNSA